MTEILKDCSNCEGSKYCITKPNKNDYKFPEEENQYLIDLECGIWDCHTAVSKLLKENAELKERLKSEANEIIKDLLYCTDGIVEVSIPEENRFLSVKKLKARAEKFLKELCE